MCHAEDHFMKTRLIICRLNEYIFQACIAYIQPNLLHQTVANYAYRTLRNPDILLETFIYCYCVNSVFLAHNEFYSCYYRSYLKTDCWGNKESKGRTVVKFI